MHATPPIMRANSYLEELGTLRGGLAINVLKEVYIFNDKYGRYLKQSEGIYATNSGILLSDNNNPAIHIDTGDVIYTADELKKYRGDVIFGVNGITLPDQIYRSNAIGSDPGYPLASFMVLRDILLHFLVHRNPYKELSNIYHLYNSSPTSEFIYMHYLFTDAGILELENGDISFSMFDDIIANVDISTQDKVCYEFYVTINNPNIIVYYISDVRALRWMKEQDEKLL